MKLLKHGFWIYAPVLVFFLGAGWPGGSFAAQGAECTVAVACPECSAPSCPQCPEGACAKCAAAEGCPRRPMAAGGCQSPAAAPRPKCDEAACPKCDEAACPKCDEAACPKCDEAACPKCPKGACARCAAAEGCPKCPMAAGCAKAAAAADLPQVIALKFHADGCGYCKVIRPVFEELRPPE